MVWVFGYSRAVTRMRGHRRAAHAWSAAVERERATRAGREDEAGGAHA